jgi:hypothetical protein
MDHEKTEPAEPSQAQKRQIWDLETLITGKKLDLYPEPIEPGSEWFSFCDEDDL